MIEVFMVIAFGIYSLFVPQSEKQRIMDEEATEWYYEQNS